MTTSTHTAEPPLDAVGFYRCTWPVILVRLSLATAVACGSGCAAAMTGARTSGSWARVEQLSGGEHVEIRRVNGQVSEGVVAGVDAGAITVSAAEGTSSERLPKQDIRQVQVVRRDRADSKKNGAAIGALVGAVYVIAGLAYVAANGDAGEPSSGAWATAPAGAAVGAGLGTLIDAAMKRPHRVTVYRR